MSPRIATLLMVSTALMWSVSGVITRYLDAADGFEAVFWRSLFATLTMVVALGWKRGLAGLVLAMRRGGWVLWVSGCCWAVMFSAFVLALMLTNVANVLVTIAMSPLLTALLTRVALGHRLPLRTSFAILMAGVGVFWMYGGELTGDDPNHVLGTAIALCIPFAAAVNLTLLQYVAGREAATRPDMLLSVLLGAALAAAVSLPLSLPFAATPGDTGLLFVMGSVALAVPCLLLVVISRVLTAPEISLYALLEVLFGVTWVWLAVGETPAQAVLIGGVIVLLSLAMNEALALRSQRRHVLPDARPA